MKKKIYFWTTLIGLMVITGVFFQSCKDDNDGKSVETPPFENNVPLPVIEMFYCEFVPEGEIFRIKGNHFINPVEVFFYGEDGQTFIQAEVVDIKDARELYVKVPAGAGDSKPVIVQNDSGRTESKILFRDRRNMIIDFDEYKGFGGGLRDSEEGGFTFPSFRDFREDIYSPSTDCPNEYLIGDQTKPESFPKGCDGRYNLLNAWSDRNWQYANRIQFHIKEDPDDPTPNPRRNDPVLSKSLMGPFLNEYDTRSMVLKFEVYVPKKYPINGAWLLIYFPPAGGEAWDSNSGWGLTSPQHEPVEKQVPVGWWCPFEADIDKTAEDEWWRRWQYGANCKAPFHTNDTWMTVSVPLSKIIFNGYMTPGSWLHKGDTGIPFDYSDDGNPALSPNTVLSKDPTKALGDMIVQFPTWSGVGNQSGKFMLFVDNFRLVPEDKGGVVFGRGTGAERAY